MSQTLMPVQPSPPRPTPSGQISADQKIKAASSAAGSTAVTICTVTLIALGLSYVMLWLVSKHRHRGSTYVRHRCHWLPGINRDPDPEDDLEETPRQKRRRKREATQAATRTARGKRPTALPLTESAFPATTAAMRQNTRAGYADPTAQFTQPAQQGDDMPDGVDGEGEAWPGGFSMQAPPQQQPGLSMQPQRQPAQARPSLQSGQPPPELGDAAYAEISPDQAQPSSPAYAAFDNPPSPAYSRFPPGANASTQPPASPRGARERPRDLQPPQLGPTAGAAVPPSPFLPSQPSPLGNADDNSMPPESFEYPPFPLSPPPAQTAPAPQRRR